MKKGDIEYTPIVGILCFTLIAALSSNTFIIILLPMYVFVSFFMVEITIDLLPHRVLVGIRKDIAIRKSKIIVAMSRQFRFAILLFSILAIALLHTSTSSVILNAIDMGDVSRTGIKISTIVTSLVSYCSWLYWYITIKKSQL